MDENSGFTIFFTMAEVPVVHPGPQDESVYVYKVCMCQKLSGVRNKIVSYDQGIKGSIMHKVLKL